MMCDVCDFDFGHVEGCPLSYDEPYDSLLEGESSDASLSCSVCGDVIGHGQLYIYHPNGEGEGIVCSECIECFSLTDVLEVCGLDSVTEAIAELSGKVMRAGDRY